LNRNVIWYLVILDERTNKLELGIGCSRICNFDLFKADFDEKSTTHVSVGYEYDLKEVFFLT
jgi:hypothetical protein